MEALDRLLTPRSLALIGASESSLWSQNLIANLRNLGYPGSIHLVHPRLEEQFGVRTHRSVEEISGEVDCAWVMTGTGAALEVVESCGRKGVQAIVMLTRHPALLVRTARGALLLLNRARRRPAETGVARLAGLTQDLRSIRPTPRAWAESVGLALLNWLLDIGALAACCAAFDLHVSLSVLLLTYTAGMAAAGLTPLPAGVGAVETAMTLGLTLGGATASAALGVVLLYRLISVGSTVAVGWIVVALQPHHHHTGVEPIGSQH